MAASDPDRVVLFKGASQYGSVNAMVGELPQAFARRGLRPVVVDMTEDALKRDLEPLLEDGAVALFCCVNGIGLPSDGAGFYALSDAPVFAYFVDHPVYHLDRLRAAVPRLTVSFPTADNVACCRRMIGPVPPACHVAHGAAAVAETPWEDRDIPVLFAGTCHGGPPEDQRRAWRGRGDGEARVLGAIVEAHDVEPETPLELVIAEVTGLDEGDGAALAPVFIAADTYLRDRAKARVVAALAGTGAVVCGEHWGFLAGSVPGVRFEGARPTTEVKPLMRKAKITFNALPPYYASHERVFQAMAAGSVAASPRSPLWRETFPAGEMIELPYGEAGVGEVLRAALADDGGLRRMAEAGRRAFAAAHTWDHRAGAILDAIAGGGKVLPAGREARA